LLEKYWYSCAYASIISTDTPATGCSRNALLKLSRLIDTLNEKIGLIANWLVLIAFVISAGNALMRYSFSLSSNAWLEIQWYLFGGMVLLGANLQTSFMHPPFGFALFYLRGVAPKEVKSSDIYWGAVPWVGMQLVLVAIIIFWPGLVTDFVPKPATLDPARIEIQMDQPGDAREDSSAEIERQFRQQK